MGSRDQNNKMAEENYDNLGQLTSNEYRYKISHKARNKVSQGNKSFNSNLSFNQGTGTQSKEESHQNLCDNNKHVNTARSNDQNSQEELAQTEKKRTIELNNINKKPQHPHFIQQESTEILDEIQQIEATSKAPEDYLHATEKILRDELKSREHVIQAMINKNCAQTDEAIAQALKDFILRKLADAYLKAYSKVQTTNIKHFISEAAEQAIQTYTLHKKFQQKEKAKQEIKELNKNSCCVIL